jgi:hypothetical protein
VCLLERPDCVLPLMPLGHRRESRSGSPALPLDSGGRTGLELGVRFTFYEALDSPCLVTKVQSANAASYAPKVGNCMQKINVLICCRGRSDSALDSLTVDEKPNLVPYPKLPSERRATH